jgi:hippurate hydrolase
LKITAEQLLNEAEKIREIVTNERRILTDMGIAPQECGRAGVTAVIGDRSAEKVFLLRADMDALPIREESGLDFAAENGSMHACGHDMHTSMLLGAARLLKAHESELCGAVKLMFQPAEEIFEGSSDMIKAGILENPRVDAALMIHVMTGLPIEAGTVVVSGAGVSAPAADCFEITVKGRGCHGAMPEKGADPITAASHIVINLQEISGRELSMNDRAALTIGSFNAGDTANVIPNAAVLSGSMRTYDEETRKFIKRRLTEISEGTAAVFRCTADVRFVRGCPTLYNDPALSECAQKYTRELLGEERALSADKLGGSGGSVGSEDFAYVSREVPSIMLALAAGSPENGFSHPLHHPKAMFDEKVLSAGSAVYAYNAIRWLEEN